MFGIMIILAALGIAGIGYNVGMRGGFNKALKGASADVKAALQLKGKSVETDVVRGAVSEISQSIWEQVDNWYRESEDKITNKNSNISIWIGNGLEGVAVTGAISIADLWPEEKKMLWGATQFFEGEHMSELLSTPSISSKQISKKMKREVLKAAERYGRKFTFDANGDVVLLKEKK